MAIGTSLGAYFEDEFHHQAGIDTPPEVKKPADTGDDNTLPPDEGQYDKPKPLEVSFKDRFRPMSPDVLLNQQNTANQGGSEALSDLRVPGLPPVSTLQEAIARVRRQPSNITEPSGGRVPAEENNAPQSSLGAPTGLLETPPRPVPRFNEPEPQQQHEDSTDYALRLISHALDHPEWHGTTPQARESSRELIDNSLEAHRLQGLLSQGRDVASNAGRAIGDLVRSETAGIRETVNNAYNFVTGAKSKIANPDTEIGSIALKKTNEDDGPRHKFTFFHEDTGTLGHINITEQKDGKELYFNGIGLSDGITPNSIGKTGMRDLIRNLKEQFPEAETIRGFRISGARQTTGSGSAYGGVRIRPAKPQPERKSIQELNTILDTD